METSTSNSTTPTLEEIRAECSRVFGVRACLWQAQFTEAILKRNTDVVLNVGTGMGKTLAFWLPLLFKKDGIQIVVTALNIVGKQNVDSLRRAGISAVDINAENATAQNFRDIADGKHRVVVGTLFERAQDHCTRCIDRLRGGAPRGFHSPKDQ